eukprot:GHUV01032146.1.p1 GENE.GHUV01032146.1~~GHUV01032146.1.p1  ORF type:complete len:132 (+),score=22.81 GHUV01032146.1:187-582(+)
MPGQHWSCQVSTGDARPSLITPGQPLYNTATARIARKYGPCAWKTACCYERNRSALRQLRNQASTPVGQLTFLHFSRPILLDSSSASTMPGPSASTASVTQPTELKMSEQASTCSEQQEEHNHGFTFLVVV